MPVTSEVGLIYNVVSELECKICTGMGKVGAKSTRTKLPTEPPECVVARQFASKSAFV